MVSLWTQLGNRAVGTWGTVCATAPSIVLWVLSCES